MPHTKHPRPTLAALVASVAAASGASAQGAEVIPPSQYQGPFSGNPIGLQLEGAAFTNLPRQVIRTSGINTGFVTGWNETTFGAEDPEHPDYSAQALYAHWVPSIYGQTPAQWSAADPGHEPVLGGFSTGGDVTPPVDASGQLMPGGALAWYSLSFAVDPDAVGESGSAVQLAGGNPGGWVFTYFDEGSELIREQLVDSIVVDYTRAQLAPGVAGNDTAITGLDWGMGLIASTPGGEPSPMQPSRGLFYFTLDAEWVAAHCPAPYPWQFDGLDSLVPGAQPVQIDVDPGTVYAMAWLGTEWSLPAVAFDHTELYGDAQSDVAIDALSVFRRANEPAHAPSTVVFSLEPDSTVNGVEVDQILVSQVGSYTSGLATVTALPLRSSGGMKVSEKAKLYGPPSSIGPDDVDALCGLDPHELQSRDPYVGCPVNEQEDAIDAELGLALFRGWMDDDASSDEVVIGVTGIQLSSFDFGFIQIDLEDSSVSQPQLPVDFVPQLTSDPILLLDDSPFELRVPAVILNAELRVRARVHGVLPGFVPVLDNETSWVSVIGVP